MRAFEAANTDEHLRMLINQAYSHSWISTDGLLNLSRTKVGTRSGEPLGDLIYNFVIANVLRNMHIALQQPGLVDEFPLQPGDAIFHHPERATTSIHVCDDSYVDDTLVLSSAKGAWRALESLNLISIIVNTFSSHSLRLSWSPGKSETMLMLVGEGTEQVREIIHVDHHGFHTCFVAQPEGDLQKTVTVPVVEVYENLRRKGASLVFGRS